MGCQSSKSSPPSKNLKEQEVLQQDPECVASQILSVINDLEKVKNEATSFSKSSSQKIQVNQQSSERVSVRLSIDGFLIPDYDPEVERKSIEQMFLKISKVFSKANTLLSTIQIMLKAHKSHKIILNKQIKEVFEEFLELFYQITQDILKLPFISQDQVTSHQSLRYIKNTFQETEISPLNI